MAEPPAVTQLRLARAYIDEMFAYSDKHGSLPPHYPTNMRTLSHAAKALRRARRLDPSAVYHYEDKKGSVDYTPDMMAGEILHLEAAATFNHAHDPPMSLRGLRREFKFWHRPWFMWRALKAVNKSLEFWPTNVPTYHTKARILWHWGFLNTADKVVEQALALDPTNIETHKLKDGLR